MKHFWLFAKLNGHWAYHKSYRKFFDAEQAKDDLIRNPFYAVPVQMWKIVSRKTGDISLYANRFEEATGRIIR